MEDIPRITFGIIVLNGEPFTRYNLRAIYPFAYEIIVVEGASAKAAHMASKHGHSVDGTLEVLFRFKEEEDYENKIVIITAEDKGYPNGFWPGDKDEQSQAYAERASGDWLWQVDIDEFYHPEDTRRLCSYLARHPETGCITLNAQHFWGDFDYQVDGGIYMSHRFQGERWGAYRRIFRWGRGYRYLTHRPPTVLNSEGEDLVQISNFNATRGLKPSVYMYHYNNMFLSQVIPKGKYYANQGWPVAIEQQAKYERFIEPLNLRGAIRVKSHFGTYNWLRRFQGAHPPMIEALHADIESGCFNLQMRSSDDIDRILDRKYYPILIWLLYRIEWLRSRFLYALFAHKLICKRILAGRAIPSRFMLLLPISWQEKIKRLEDGSKANKGRALSNERAFAATVLRSISVKGEHAEDTDS